MNIIQLMMMLIRKAVGEKSDELDYQLTDETLEKLYKLSKSHDLSHLLTVALEDIVTDRNSAIFRKFQQQTFVSISRYERMNYEFESICSVFENARIPFIPLKGAVLRQFYPEPWMRTSCDIDIYVEKDKLKDAISVLKNELEYEESGRCSYDVALFSKSGVNIELHFELIESAMVNNSARILSKVWEYSRQVSGYSYRYEMCDEMFYFYHIAHMAKHFKFAGCGVRPFLDLWILNHRVEHDLEKRDKLLKQGGLLTFANFSKSLSEVWFGNEEHSEITLQMEQYLIGAGVYGNCTNLIAVNYTKNGGKLKYLLARIWLPYDKLKYVYPSLENRRVLTPFYQIRRWCSLFQRKRWKKVRKETKILFKKTAVDSSQTEKFFSEIGLKIK